MADRGFACAYKTGEPTTTFAILQREEFFWNSSEGPDVKNKLQRLYGNQALILQAWGRLEEAFELHKKEEAICLELGNKASLGICYANWGILARQQNDPTTAQQMLEAALDISAALKMPASAIPSRPI